MGHDIQYKPAACPVCGEKSAWMGSTRWSPFKGSACSNECGYGPLPAGIEVHHEGRCGRCGRALTVPESIESGFGPECAGRAK